MASSLFVFASRTVSPELEEQHPVETNVRGHRVLSPSSCYSDKKAQELAEACNNLELGLQVSCSNDVKVGSTVIPPLHRSSIMATFPIRVVKYAKRWENTMIKRWSESLCTLTKHPPAYNIIKCDT